VDSSFRELNSFGVGGIKQRAQLIHGFFFGMRVFQLSGNTFELFAAAAFDVRPGGVRQSPPWVMDSGFSTIRAPFQGVTRFLAGDGENRSWQSSTAIPELGSFTAPNRGKYRKSREIRARHFPPSLCLIGPQTDADPMILPKSLMVISASGSSFT